jgi:hypothetical protein
MGQKSKKEYLLATWARYQRVGRRFKSKILDEFGPICAHPPQVRDAVPVQRAAAPICLLHGPMPDYHLAYAENLYLLRKAGGQ